MKNTLAFLLLVLPFIFMNACKKQNNFLPITSELKSAYSYMPGSYWIYKDALTGQIDSFAVVDIMHDTFNSSGTLIEQFAVIIDEHNHGNPIRWVYSFKENLFTFDQFYAYYPFQSGRIVYKNSSPTDSSFLSVNNTLHIDGRAFTNLFTISTISFANDSPKHADTVFFNPDLGVVKLSVHRINDTPLYMNRIWELQRWHINK